MAVATDPAEKLQSYAQDAVAQQVAKLQGIAGTEGAGRAAKKNGKSPADAPAPT